METDLGTVSISCIDKICPELNIQLTSEELDHIAAIMYKESKEIERLPYSHFLKAFDKKEQENISSVPEEQPKEESIHKEENEQKVDCLENSKPKRAATRSEPHESVPLVADQEENKGEEYATLNEEQMLEIAQKCFGSIARILEKYKDHYKKIVWRHNRSDTNRGARRRSNRN